MGEEDEAGGGVGTEWEGLRWSGRRAGDKETSASAILEEQAYRRRRRERVCETKEEVNTSKL